MDQFTTKELSALADKQGENLVSLYMPMHRAGREVQQNRIRFKNRIDQARALVTSGETNSSAVASQLDEIASWEGDDERWQHQSDGLAVFLDGQEVRSWRLPIDFNAVCHVSDNFYVRPLSRFLQNDGRYYVLAVSQNDVRLFYGSKQSLAEIEDAQLPDDLRSALDIDEYVHTLQHHSTSRGNEAMFHGQGGGDPDVEKQDEIKQYFHHIDASLNKFFGVERLPLIFAGVGYLFPIFKKVCSYDGLVGEAIKGSPDNMSADELHEACWPIASKQFESQKADLLERFGTAKSQQLGTDKISEIQTAAQQGQIETLLVASDEQLGSHAKDESAEIAKKLNDAVVATLRNNGQVYSVDDERLPTTAGAILRYPLTANANS